MSRTSRPFLLLVLPLLLVAIALAVAVSLQAQPATETDEPVAAEVAPPAGDGLLAGDQAWVQMTGCSAEQECYCTPQKASCTGTTSCTVGSTYVVCDGNQVDCPNPNIPVGCADVDAWCECRDLGGPRPYCTINWC